MSSQIDPLIFCSKKLYRHPELLPRCYQNHFSHVPHPMSWSMSRPLHRLLVRIGGKSISLISVCLRINTTCSLLLRSKSFRPVSHFNFKTWMLANSVSSQFDVLIFCSKRFYRHPELLLRYQNHCWHVLDPTSWNISCPLYRPLVRIGVWEFIFIFIKIITMRRLFWRAGGSFGPASPF